MGQKFFKQRLMSSILGSEGGGSEPNNSPTDPGDNNPGDDPGSSGDGGENPPGNNPPPAFTGIEEWKNTLPSEISGDPSMKAITDINGLAKSYVHSQKMIGADKIQVPDQYADDAQWRQIYNKLGLPENEDDYKLNLSEDSMDKDFLNNFKKQSFDIGILPKHAEKLIGWYNTEMTTAMENQKKAAADAVQDGLKGLQKEWGEGFEAKANLAARAVEHFGGEDLQKYFNDSGLGNDVQLIKLFSQIGEGLKEDTFTREKRGTFGTTKEDATVEINQIMGDPNSPYFDSKHPQHQQVVNHMTKLHSILDS